jgi:fructose-1,6-bisphosphatase/inositol monophosphatase family enzyme
VSRLAADPASVAALIREAARAEILPRFRALRQGEVREKGPNDFVTVADEAAERVLTARLAAADPGAAVLGEEAAARDPALLGLLSRDAPVWVLDPIDGTINFAHGRPGFATLLAYVVGGETRAGWLYDPVEDTMVWAARGGGAWRDGERLAVAGDTPAERMVGSAYLGAETLAASGAVGGVRNWLCGGVEYIDIALGRAHFCLHARSLPWDHAAGMLVMAEAGVSGGFLDGSPYNARIIDRPVGAAASAEAWRRLRALVAASV